jgi:hypothetical protein
LWVATKAGANVTLNRIGCLFIKLKRARSFLKEQVHILIYSDLNPYVKNVRALDDYQLTLEFENIGWRIFDMKPYFNRGIFTRLQNPTLFQAVRVVAGSVEWPGGLDLSYDTLYLESQPVAAETIDSLVAENSLN